MVTFKHFAMISFTRYLRAGEQSAGERDSCGNMAAKRRPAPRLPRYDVFLSHKRTDAKDFARALYNLLVLRGITCFLDFEYR